MISRRVLRSRNLPSAISITGKEEISTTYGEHKYIKKINQHLLLGPIGEGSFSRVFIAVNATTGQRHAIKRIHLQKVAKTSTGIVGIQREIALMQRLSHPNIVNLHEVIYVRQTRTVFLVLDYANCGSLARMIKNGVIFTSESIRYIFKQIAEGVSYLHKNRIVHQDLKPENILLREDGTVLISDFGTGHRFQSCARGFGTPAYQAPELINRSAPEDDIEPGKEDIWSLGVTLYYLHFKSFPFPGGNVFEIAKAVTSTSLKPPDGCDPILWDLIVNTLEADPRKRFGIQNILKHAYVEQAPTNVEMGLTPIPIPELDQGLPVKTTPGIVIPEGGILDFPELKERPRVKYFQAPFPM